MRPCNMCQTKNCRGSSEADMRKECRNYTPIKRTLGTLLEELIETSPAALSQVLLDLNLEIRNATRTPFFSICGRG